MKFDVKAIENKDICCDGEDASEKRQPTIWLDDILPAEVVKKLSVGEEFSITLTGKISTLTHREGEDYGPTTEVRMSVSSGSVEDGNEFADLADMD